MATFNSDTIVSIFAHPDDEVFSVGGTIAQHAAKGRVVAVCATRGELGEIRDPSLATRENLGAVREQELLRAYGILGVSDVRFLDYRDSGMDGTEGNQDHRAFMNADPNEAVGKIVKILREIGPSAVVTFEETGGYGHPDHLAVHRFVTEAFKAASDPNAYPEHGDPIDPGRLFYSGFPRSLMKRMFGRAQEQNVDVSVFNELDIDKLGLPDEALDVVADVAEFLELKTSAMRAHGTQYDESGPLSQAPEEVRREFGSHEYFQFGSGVELPEGRPQTSLFA
ncbi:MAG: PIG-L family deacetylase [Nitrolancea sp.]